MDALTHDRRFQNDVVSFPEHLTPFPDHSDILFDDRSTETRSPEIEHHPHLPPQKLRPIRRDGRVFPEYSNPLATESRVIDGALLSCQSELGFLSQLSPQMLSSVNDGPDECIDTPPDLGSGSFPENGGSGVAGNLFPALQQMKSEINAECLNLINEGRLLAAELSSSSDDGANSSKAISEPLNPERRRRSREKLELFMENMINKVIQKQEQMYKQLIQMMEEKEKERIIREEGWKQQEIERTKKNEEVRAQERSRNVAFISFIRNVLGCEIQIPEPLEISCQEKDDDMHNQMDLKCDPNSKRWPKSEVQALITVRMALDYKFQDGPKGSVWEEVVLQLSKMGYTRSAKKCKQKWENINKYYKRTTEKGKKRLDNGKTCPYFHELDILYKCGQLNARNASHCLKNGI